MLLMQQQQQQGGHLIVWFDRLQGGGSRLLFGCFHMVGRVWVAFRRRAREKP
jgi:hypothetical protein